MLEQYLRRTVPPNPFPAWYPFLLPPPMAVLAATCLLPDFLYSVPTTLAATLMIYAYVNFLLLVKLTFNIMT